MAQETQNTSYDTASESLPGLMKAVKSPSLKYFSPSVQTVSKIQPTMATSVPQIQPKGPLAQPETTNPTEPLPGNYSSFLPADTENRWVAPSPLVVSRNWPADLGGGQYAIDPSQPGALIKSGRADTPEVKKVLRNGLPSTMTEIDHVYPLWLGGEDTLANKQLLSASANANKQKLDSITITLLANGKLGADQIESIRNARLNWSQNRNVVKPTDFDQIPKGNTAGQIPLADALKWQAQFDERTKNPEPVTIPSILKNVPKELADLTGAQGPLAKAGVPEAARVFAKSFVEGATLGWTSTPTVPETASAGWEGDLNNKVVLPIVEMTGNLLGNIATFGWVSKGLGLAKTALLNTPLAKIVKTASVPFIESTPWGIKTAEEISAASKATAEVAGKVKGGLSLGKKGMTLGEQAVEAGEKLGISTKTPLTSTKVWEAAKTGLEWAAFGQLSKRQENGFNSRATSFVTDALTGGMMSSTGQSAASYAKMFTGLTTLGIMGNYAAGEPISGAFQNALMLTTLHSLGNPKLEKFGMDNSGSILEDVGIKDPVKSISQTIKDKIGYKGAAGAASFKGEPDSAETFAQAIDQKANTVATAYLKNIAPEATAAAEFSGETKPVRTGDQISAAISENKPTSLLKRLSTKLGISKVQGEVASPIGTPTVESKLNYDMAKKGTVGITKISSETFQKVKTEAIHNIYMKEAAGEITPAQRDLAIKQTFVAIRQLEKGGMTANVRVKADATDADSIVQGVEKNTKIKGSGTYVDEELHQMYGTNSPVRQITPNSATDISKGDFVTGIGATTGTADVIDGGTTANNIARAEIAKTRGQLETFLVKRPAGEVQGIADIENAKPEVLAGHKKPYDPKYFIENVSKITHSDGSVEWLHTGWVSTEYRIAGPRITDWSKVKDPKTRATLKKADAQAFNMHKDVRSEANPNGTIEAYDPSFNNETIGKAMEALGLNHLKVETKSLYDPKHPFTAKGSGQKHIQFEITENNWRDELANKQMYSEGKFNEPAKEAIPTAKALNPQKDVNGVDIVPETAPGTPVSPVSSPVEAPDLSKMSNVPSQGNEALKLAENQGKGQISQIIRHGTTDNNGDGKIRGQRDIPATQLSEKGIKEAQDLGEKMAVLPPEQKPDIIVPSDMNRAKDTAKIISEKTGIPVGEPEAGLRSQGMGIYNDAIEKEVRPELKKFATEKPNEKLPGADGESHNDFVSRVSTTMKTLEDKYPGKKIAVVTHHQVEKLQASNFGEKMDVLYSEGIPPASIRNVNETKPLIKAEVKESSPLAKTIVKEASKRSKESDQAKYKQLANKMVEINKKATSEGRPLEEGEKKAMESLDKKTSTILKKYKALNINKGETQSQISKNVKESYATALVAEGKDIIDNYKPRTLGSEKELTNQLFDAAMGKKPQKPRDMTTADYKNMIDSYEGQMKEYASEITKRKLTGNEFMEPEGAEKVVTKVGDTTRITYPEGEKVNKGEKTKVKKEIAPDKEAIDMLAKKNAGDIKKWVEDMSKSDVKYAQGLGSRTVEGLKEIFGDKFEENPYFKKIIDPSNRGGLMSRLFSSTNVHGYSMSQPKDYLTARMRGTEADVKKAGEKIAKQRAEESVNRGEAELPAETGNYLDRVKESGQDEGMVQDIIGLEQKLPGLLKEETTGEKATRADGLKDGTRLLVDISKEYNQLLNEEGRRPEFFNAKKYENIDKKAIVAESTPKTGIEGLKERLAKRVKKSTVDPLEEKYKDINTVSELSAKFDDITEAAMNRGNKLNQSEEAEKDFLRKKITSLLKR